MEWIIGLVCLLVGAGAGTGITLSVVKKKPAEIQVIEKMVEVDTSLSNTDLLQIPCSKEYLEKNGEALCREMFCRMNTRSGNQSNAASSKECEAIGNILNKSLILRKCSDLAKSRDLAGTEFDVREKACIEFFDRRI